MNARLNAFQYRVKCHFNLECRSFLQSALLLPHSAKTRIMYMIQIYNDDDFLFLNRIVCCCRCWGREHTLCLKKTNMPLQPVPNNNNNRTALNRMCLFFLWHHWPLFLSPTKYCTVYVQVSCCPNMCFLFSAVVSHFQLNPIFSDLPIVKYT